MAELLYKKIYHYLKDKMSDGSLQAGDQLPTEKELSELFSVSRITSKRAFVELENEGLISRQRGKGSFVKEIKVANGSEKKLIAFLLPFEASNELTDYAKGIVQELSKGDFQLTINLVKNVSVNQVSDYAGIILYPENTNQSIDLLFQCQLKEMPLVLLDKHVEGFEAPTVVSENHIGSYNLTKHLFETGCQEILYVGQESLGEVSSVRDRYLGYLQALTEEKMASHHWIIDKNHSLIDELVSLASYLKASKCRKTGLVVENDWLAIQILQYLQQDNFCIPDDVAIVGFDNIQAASLLTPGLTTARQDFLQIGQEAARMLVKMITTGQDQVANKKVPVQIYYRNSSQK
ncbi:GntR family transcriptional regulator [Streptococcus parauberis]|uniref:GntR family transcriptional regulator n=1 Tax=Streptococcus parauberis TaxID=1348 RepID=UPI00020CBDB6|nr:GntR family transcriptional regulator [Streptococcus parauberis]AEF25663.1 transcriptional repressor AraR-like protein [Streptococcus parauberis KCTC 11537]UWM90129.1 GntR family transcriptional regulator [Streptococcus parauberis]GAJ61974.1 transcriptional repressor AraR-like protein [Streptococcus parauberis]